MANLFHNHWKIIVSAILMVLIIVGVLFSTLGKNEKVIGVGDFDYTKSDFNMYVYSGKYNIYGKDKTNLPKATLNSEYEKGVTVREYLKKKAVNEIMIAGIVRTMAKENDIKLSTTDKLEIKKEKNNYIESLGGIKEFKRLLDDNNTTESAYDKMLETDKFYNLLFEKLYAKNKQNDLTSGEKKKAEKEYNKTYYKIKQIIIAKINLKTSDYLSKTEINQKRELAKSLLERAEEGEDFDYLIKNYSDDTTKKDDYAIYFTKGEIRKEIEKVAISLDYEEVSNLIETNKAFYIIKREELDNKYLSNFYDKKRDQKLLTDIANYQKDVAIIYYDGYEKIKIN